MEQCYTLDYTYEGQLQRIDNATISKPMDIIQKQYL